MNIDSTLTLSIVSLNAKSFFGEIVEYGHSVTACSDSIKNVVSAISIRLC